MRRHVGRRRLGPGRVIGLIVGVAVICWAVAALGLYLAQRRMIFHPDPSRVSVEAVGLGMTEIALRLPDGRDMLAWYLPPRRPDRPVVAYFHGNAGNLSDRVARARTFAGVGWGVLMPEYPGYGGNPGDPSEASFEAVGRAALDRLDTLGIPGRLVAVYGESIGTAVATIASAGRPCAALLLEAPFTSITDIARRRFPWLPVALMLRDPFDQAARIGAVRCPVLVMQGDRDDIVPPDLGRALFALAPEPKQLWIAKGGGHADLAAYGALDVAIGFVEQAVSHAIGAQGIAR
jgi:fermentation-respiration switch protein FrsA (DUF1100 family)